ncbi:Na(+)/H(+) antiporter subunit B [Acetobacterium sp.]|uniref:Na(+)/H(+) antiporter subunit B n=1 Tax=Acetobacterium sp. TaxID=1872094 RepID=UPI0035948C4D
MTENIFLITLVVLAIVALNTKKLRRAIVYLGVFSLVSSFVYLLYGAPDVAIAEAIIGSTITTVLYLVALRKYQVFSIYYANSASNQNNRYLKNSSNFLKNLETFLIQREMEPQIIYSGESIETILDQEKFDLAIHHADQDIWIYGCVEDYQIDAVEEYLQANYGDLNIHLIRCAEGEDNEA